MKGARPMPSPVDRRSVDLSAFPDLVVIYLGMRVRTLGGIKMLLGLGPQIDKAGAGRPEGLLHFENNIIFSSSRSTSECAGIGTISPRWSGGRAPNPTGSGGRISSVIPGGPVSGMRPTS